MAWNVLDDLPPSGQMHTLLQHLCYTVRLLRKSPGFTVTAVVIVAFGIGVNTAVFSLIDTVLLSPLAYPDADRLVEVCFPYQRDMLRWTDYLNCMDLIAAQHTFESLAVARHVTLDLEGQGEAKRIEVHFVSAGLSKVSRLPITVGRWFTPEEDVQHGPLVAVLSDPFWKTQYQSDPNIVGKTITASGFTFQIIGVAPLQANAGGGMGTVLADVYVPVNAFTTVFNEPLTKRGGLPVDLIGRLKAGVKLDEAEADLKTIQDNLAIRYPDTDSGRGVRLLPIRDRVVIQYSGTIWLLGAAAACLLLISCANVANLLYTRAVERGREMNIRSALGATRRRLIGQLLWENAFLCCIGGIIGVVISVWAVGLIKALSPPDLYGLSEISIDTNALMFVLAVTVFVAVGSGLLPAWKISKVELASALKAEDSRGATIGKGRQRSQSLLVIGQVSLACWLLIGAGLLARSFLSAQTVPLGFNPHNVLTATVDLTAAKYTHDAAGSRSFWEDLLVRTRRLPGVESVALNDMLPLKNGFEVISAFTLQGQPDPGPGRRPLLDWQLISPDYFRLLRIPLVQGRDFDEADNADSRTAIIIDSTIAESCFPGKNPIGKVINFDGRACTVIGVASRIRYMAPGDWESGIPQAYFCYRQWDDTYEDVVVRCSGDPKTLVSSLRKVIASIDPNVAIRRTSTYDELIDSRLMARKLSFILVGVFSGAALFLSAIGLYATLSYTISQRTREIGIRIALGATASKIRMAVLRQGLTLVCAGLLFGTVAALIGGRFIESVLYGVTGTDPLTLGLTFLVLGAVAMLACLLPARRAARIDPITALRQ
jgi:putative ABC transport system permease protein